MYDSTSVYILVSLDENVLNGKGKCDERLSVLYRQKWVVIGASSSMR